MICNPPYRDEGPVVRPLFTKKEIAVVILTCQQLSNKEIAGRLRLSVRTVECHKKNMMLKTGSRNMIGLVMYAVKYKIFLPALLYLLPICL